MTNKTLESLIEKGLIKSYSLETFDEDGKKGRGRFRNSEKLTIIFPDESVIEIDTVCAGCSEDTFFIIK